MSIIRSLNQLSAEHRPSVVTIGNFDGVHLGHQQVISTLLKASEQYSLPATVMTFDPLAKEFFAPEHTKRLLPTQQRIDELLALGVDNVLCVPFNQQFANQSANEFIENVLVAGLGVRYLSVGDDFRFGKNRQGDFELLKQAGEQHGFEVVSHDTYQITEQRVSSERIRKAISGADFTLAKQLLGKQYRVNGIVSKGDQKGRTIGFPTANIVLDALNYALSGVYAVRVNCAENQNLNAVANIGYRPTVDGDELRLEVHILDFEQDLYDANISVEFCKKLRDEQKFDNFELLQQQIKQDVLAARDYFAAN